MLPLGPGSSIFQFWSVHTATNTATLLDQTGAGSYMPMAALSIISEDPYPYIPRTRADRPFTVKFEVQGLMSDPMAPDYSKSVDLMWHIQAYPPDSDGNDINRDDATLMGNVNIASNGHHSLVFPITSIPGTDPGKARGEERFSIYSKADYQGPAMQLANSMIQIWPVADGSITGITEGGTIGPEAPDLALTLNDLYPFSTTYAVIYPGPLSASEEGARIPYSHVDVNSNAPVDTVLTLDRYGHLIDADGIWTIEVRTDTPFGTDQVAHVTFNAAGLAVTGAIINGISHGEVVNPDDLGITLHYHQLSPVSFTKAILYPGDLNPLATQTTIPGSSLAINVPQPANYTISLPNFWNLLTQNGEWTIEVLHSTGGTTERLAEVTFMVDGITKLPDWRFAHFGSSDDRGPGADDFDFDNDGIANIIEFAFGLDPLEPSSGQLPAPIIDGGYFTLSFTRPPGIRGISYGAEWSSTLADDWLPIPDTGTFPEHRFRMPTSGMPTRYMRTVIIPGP